MLRPKTVTTKLEAQCHYMLERAFLPLEIKAARSKDEEQPKEQKYKYLSFSFFSHLIFLLEAISLSCLHLVDVLEEVSHPHSRVELTRVIRRAFPPTVTVGRASQ